MSVNQQQLRALLDLSVTSSAAGVTIPIAYGTNSIPGNVIWSPGLVEHVTGLALKDTNDVTHTMNMYSYTCSFAVAFCEGPGNVTKIWGDNTVLYDNTGEFVDYQGLYTGGTLYNVGAIIRYDSGEGGERFFICVRTSAPFPTPPPSSSNPYWQLYTGGIALSGGQAFPSPTLYSGDEMQDADPTILADLGVDNTSAFRGLVYAVWKDLDVTSFNNRIPSVRAIVMSGQPLASPPVLNSGVDQIVTDICKRSGLDISLIDTSDLTPVVTTLADTYQSDGTGIPALTLLTGGTVNFYQAAHCGAPFLFTYPGDGTNRPLPSPKCTYQMTKTQTILWNPYPAQQDSTTGSYTSFCPGWTTLDSYNLLPMAIVGVMPGGSGPATYDGTAVAPWTPGNVGSWGQANWVMTQCCQLSVAVEDDYTFYCSSNDAVVIGIGNGATRVSGPMVQPSGLTMNKTAVKGYPVVFAENHDMGESDNTAQPHLDSTLSTFVVHLKVGVYGIEVDYGQHVRSRCLCLNWKMGDVQSPLLPIAGTAGAGPAELPFGFLISDQKSGRDLLTDLQKAFFFDMAESDFVLKFVRRGVHSSVMTIPEDDLGLVGDHEKLAEKLNQEQDAPRQVICNFTDPSFDYQQGSQQKRRSSRVVTSLNQTTVDLTPLALSQTFARQVAEKTLFTSWMERSPYEFNLWKAFYALLDPTDTVDFVFEDLPYQERLNSSAIGQNFALKLTGVSQLAAAFASVAPGAPPGPDPAPVVYPWLILEDRSGFILLEDDRRISISY